MKTEIISPAGNLEKLKFAVHYGADSVYFGGDDFNLRSNAGNFTLEKIEESLKFCKTNNVKTIFLLNAYLHQDDLKTASEYISMIKDFKFDGIMVSDPGMILLIKEAGIDTELHLSTQMNTLNHLAIKFWKENGIKRIVLAREVSLDEIKKIKDNIDIEIETFIHGALCIAYSGRCLLSRYLSGRDANQGDCSQPCRWKYSLIEEKREGNHLDIIEHARGTEILSSKDLCLIEKVDQYIDAGVDAFKIEGRMKSLYHSANTTRIYKHALKLAGTKEYTETIPFWNSELDLINHRPYTDDLFNEFDDLVFDGIPYIKKALFLGYKESDSDKENSILVKAFNPIRLNEEVEAIFPINEKIIDDKFIVEEIFDKNMNPQELARPGEFSTIKFNKPVADYAIFRRRQ